jgi:hypothetical protein
VNIADGRLLESLQGALEHAEAEVERLREERDRLILAIRSHAPKQADAIIALALPDREDAIRGALRGATNEPETGGGKAASSGEGPH